MDYLERGTHAQGVYPTQETSRMGTARVKHEEETNTRIMQESVRNLEERNVGTKGKNLEQGLTSAEDLTTEPPRRTRVPLT